MVPSNLLYTILVYSSIGIYTEIQMMLVSTLAEAMNSMNNYTLEHHYGIQANGPNLAMMTSLMYTSSGVGLILSIFIVIPKSDVRGRKYVCVYIRFLLGFSSSLLQLGGAIFQASELFLIAQVVYSMQTPIRTFLTVLFVCECAPDRNRGFASVAMIFCDVIGQVIMYSFTSPSLLGAPSTWFIFPLTCAVLSIILFFSTFKLPESPKWLIKMNRYDEAEQAILFYHGEDCDIDEVMMSMIKEKNLTKEQKVSFKEVLQNGTLREALKLVLLVGAFLMFSPTVVENMYTVQIHNSVGFDINEVLNINLIFSILFIPTRFAGTFLIDYFGRRPMIFLTSVFINTKIWLMTIALSLSYFSGSSWLSKSLTILSDSITQLSHGVGPSAMIPLLVSELFPPSARTVVSQCVLVFSTLCNIPTVLSFPVINSIFPPGCYIPFVFVQPIIIFYLYVHLPETKSRAVCDIIDSLDHEVASRKNTINNEKQPLINRNRTMSLANKRGSILITSRTRALTFDPKI